MSDQVGNHNFGFLMALLIYVRRSECTNHMKHQTQETAIIRPIKIRITSPCDLYPLSSQFYIVKLGFTGVYIFSYFALKHILWVLVRKASKRQFYGEPTIYVLSKTKKKIKRFANFTNICIMHGYVCVMNHCFEIST